MNKSIRIILGCIAVAVTSLAATSAPTSRVTVQRVLQLITLSGSPLVQNYQVEVSSLGKVSLPANKPEGEINLLQEVIFPTEFIPPQPDRPRGPLAILPSTPTNFESFHTGWTVRLSAKPLGKLVAVSGTADFVEATSVPAGYGEVAAPVYAGDEMVTPAVMNMPKVQTTTTRFQVFATPGQTYEVTLYRGAKAEKHRVSLTAE